MRCQPTELYQAFSTLLKHCLAEIPRRVHSVSLRIRLRQLLCWNLDLPARAPRKTMLHAAAHAWCPSGFLDVLRNLGPAIDGMLTAKLATSSQTDERPTFSALGADADIDRAATTSVCHQQAGLTTQAQPSLS